MSQAVHLPDQLVNDARRYAGINSRSVTKQIEYWSRIRQDRRGESGSAV